jgi:hypothetical protein
MPDTFPFSLDSLSTEITQREKEFRSIFLIAEIRKSFYNRSEQEIIQTFLETVSQLFQIEKAWYGICNKKSIHPVFHAGKAKELVDVIQVELESKLSEQSFPLCRAIHENRPVTINDFGQNEECVSWKPFLETSKLRSISTFPVKIHGKSKRESSFIRFRLMRLTHLRLTVFSSQSRNWLKPFPKNVFGRNSSGN